MPRRMTWVGLFIAAVLAAGCASAGGSPGDSEGDPPGNGDGPHIAILSPSDGDMQEAGNVTVDIEVSGFIMDGPAIGTTNVPGRGHWHAYLNGELVEVNVGHVMVFEDVQPGLHHLRMELHNNDHSSLDPRVDDSISIEVE